MIVIVVVGAISGIARKDIISGVVAAVSSE